MVSLAAVGGLAAKPHWIGPQRMDRRQTAVPTRCTPPPSAGTRRSRLPDRNSNDFPSMDHRGPYADAATSLSSVPSALTIYSFRSQDVNAMRSPAGDQSGAHISHAPNCAGPTSQRGLEVARSMMSIRRLPPLPVSETIASHRMRVIARRGSSWTLRTANGANQLATNIHSIRSTALRQRTPAGSRVSIDVSDETSTALIVPVSCGPARAGLLLHLTKTLP